jgi:hypothetical protein
MHIGDLSKSSKNAEPAFHESWSTISPGDLGLKAGFWTGEDSDPMTFTPIIGWITVTLRKADEPPFNTFAAVVLSEQMFPVLALTLPNHRGVFLKDMPADQAKVRAREWVNRPRGELQPTMGMGQA